MSTETAMSLEEALKYRWFKNHKASHCFLTPSEWTGSERMGDAVIEKIDGDDPGRNQAASGFPSSCQSYGNDFWKESVLVPCRDGKARRIKSGIAPLASRVLRGVVHGSNPCTQEYAENTSEARTMRLKGYGNSIVPQVGAAFVLSFMEAVQDMLDGKIPTNIPNVNKEKVIDDEDMSIR
jgi:hypothetical protein